MANENQFKLFTKFIATRGVEEYRQTIPIWVSPEDSVLEIGCEWGTTSTLIWEKCKNLIATDISLDCIKVARTKYQSIRFETLDAFNIQQAMALGQKFTKIYIEAIIIKSGSLKQFSRNCVEWKSCFTNSRLYQTKKP